MGKLTITMFSTLDGIVQAPGGPSEDTSGGFEHGGWSFPFADGDFGAFMSSVFDRADAFLLGRRTYEIFAGYWPTVTDPNDPIAGRLNRLPKHVASKTLASVGWTNASLVRNVAQDVAALKATYPCELQVHGSGDLVQTLIENDLVDEYNVLTFPIILGRGKRLFGRGTVPAAMALVSARTTSTGVSIATYRRNGKPVYGSFA